MQQVTEQVIHKAIQQTTSDSQQQQQEFGDKSKAEERLDLKVNSFFDHLKDLYGSKYKHAFVDLNGEQAAKLTYRSAIGAINDQTLVDGLRRLRSERMKGFYLWIELAEIIGFIQGSIGNVEQLKSGYREFMDGGIPIYKEKMIPSTGASVQETVGRTWSDGLIFECSKRLGSSKFLTHPESDFNGVYLQVLQESRMGKIFELPKQLEHKDSNTKTDEDRRNDIDRISKTDGFAAFQKLLNKGISE